jgi:hypothetical protein
MPASAAVSTGKPNRRKASAFTTATVASFSLTLLAASLAVFAGLVPLHSLTVTGRTTVGVFLFVVPIAALVLAVCVEVVGIAWRRAELPKPRRRQVVRWAPGQREG